MIELLSLFSGIGAFEKALYRQNINFKVVNWCENDKYASRAYQAIHNISESLNLGDIKSVDEKGFADFNLVTWGFPCQDVSLAGRQEGISKNTRSGLLFDALRIIKYKMPKYSICENVKNLVSKRFEKDFEWLLGELDSYGYNNYWKILNAKDYGVPQNRERVFLISIKRDVDDGNFSFPEGFDNGIRLRDILENKVNEKYYINNEKADKLLEELKDKKIGNSIGIGSRDIIDRHQWDLVAELNKLKFVGGIGDKDWVGDNKKFSRNYLQGNRVYNSSGIACSQTAQGGGIGGYTGLYMTNEVSDNKLQLFTNLEGGKWDKIHESARRVYNENGISPTIPTCGGGNIEPKIQTNYHIRKLTPLECWRLMGFDDDDYWNARRVLENTFYNGRKRSNSQMYKMAGNSIVVNVLEEIFKNLFVKERIKNEDR